MRDKALYRKIIVVSILFSIVVVGLVVFYMIIKNQNEKTSQIYGEIKTRTIREARLKSTKDTIEETAQARQELDKRIISDDAVVSFLEGIESLGNDLGVSTQISSVDTEGIKDSENFEWVSLVLTAVGSWSEVINYLALLENLPYRSEVGSVVIEEGGADATESGAGWRLRLEVRVAKVKLNTDE